MEEEHPREEEECHLEEAEGLEIPVVVEEV